MLKTRVVRNDVAACKGFRLARSQGLEGARTALAELYQQMTPEQIAAVYRLVWDFKAGKTPAPEGLPEPARQNT